MDPLQQIISAISGETQQANSIAPAPWQQELLETVNPEKVKKQRIAQALAKASQSLATTPGNFLQGLSAGAVTGSNDYLMSKEQADADRIKAMQAIDLDRRKQREERLRRLYDLSGLMSDEERKAYDRKWQQEGRAIDTKRYDEDLIDRKEDRADRREDRKLRRERGDSTSIQWKNQQLISRRAAGDKYEEWRGLEGMNADQATQDAKWAELLDRYGVEPDVPVTPQSTTFPTPSQAAVDALKANPGRAAEFDAKFGPGASANILGTR